MMFKMTDYSGKVEEIKKTILHASGLRQLNKATRKKYETYGLDPPSKTLKHQQPARIVEVVQNVVELRKLLNDWRQLEKARKASLSKIDRERFALETQYSRLMSGDDPRSDLQDDFHLEPGFRFKANGDIKKRKDTEITNVVEHIKNWKALKKEMRNDNDRKMTSFDPEIVQENTANVDPILGVAYENSEPYFGTQTCSGETKNKDVEGRPTKDTDTVIGTVNVTKAIEETEKALEEIYEGKELKEFKSKSQNGQKSCSTFLRAMSKENEYSGGPGAVRTRSEMRRAWAQKDLEASGKKEEKRMGFKSNCPACASKLIKRKDDSIERKLKELTKPLQKWQSVTVNSSTDSLHPKTHAARSKLNNIQSRNTLSVEEKRKRPTSHKGCKPKTATSLTQKVLQKKKPKPTSVSDVLRAELKEKKKDQILQTKSTDFMHRKQRVQTTHGLDPQEGAGDVRADYKSDVDKRNKKVKRVAKLLAKHAPCSIHPGAARGMPGETVSEKCIKYTEPIYHQMIEKNSISDQESLNGFHETDPKVFISRHLNNVELLTRGIKDEDNSSSCETVQENNVNDKRQMTEALRKTMLERSKGRIVSNSRRMSASSVDALKRIAELERRASQCKIDNFVQKLPPPTVSIGRWRAHDGVNKSVYESHARKPADCDLYWNDLNNEKDPYATNSNVLLKEMNNCKWSNG